MTPLELKVKIRALEDRITALENAAKEDVDKIREAMSTVAVQLMDSAALASKPVFDAVKIEGQPVLKPVKVEEKTPAKKLCPKCKKVPGYFFHVRSCKG